MLSKEIRKNFIFAQIALQKKDLEAVKKYIDTCPEIVKQTDYSCGTLLHQVASEGTPEMIEYLVGKGSDINRIERSWSPLISAIVRSRTDNVKKLIELGARIDNEISESNPLNYAISNNNEEIAKLLIDAGADLTIQFHPRSYEWWDALSHAKYSNAKRIYKMILKKMKKDGIDYDSIPPMPEEESMES